jgi:tetratricopeptide (TPR) repeat protein
MPKNAHLYLILGQMYWDMENEQQAVNVWLRGINRSSGAYLNWLHFSVARYHFQRNEWYQVINHYEAGLSMLPDHPTYYKLWYNLAFAYLEIEDYHKAEYAIGYALKLAPDDQESQFLMYRIQSMQMIQEE